MGVLLWPQYTQNGNSVASENATEHHGYHRNKVYQYTGNDKTYRNLRGAISWLSVLGGVFNKALWCTQSHFRSVSVDSDYNSRFRQLHSWLSGYPGSHS